MRTQKSNYVTKSGLIVLAASTLIAAYFKHTDITAFIGLILLLSLCAFLWARWSLNNIKVNINAKRKLNNTRDRLFSHGDLDLFCKDRKNILAKSMKFRKAKQDHIKNMLENDAYCTDIIVQVAAINAALNSFNKELLANHIKTCVTDDIKAGKTETVDDLLNTLQKLMR